MVSEARDWSISALAKELGVDRRTISRRIAGVSPCGKSKVGNLYKMKDVCVQVLAPGLMGAAEYTERLDLDQEKAKLAHFSAREKELVVMTLEGSLVPAADVEQLLVLVVNTAKTQLRGLGSRLAQKISAASKGGPGSIKQVLDTATTEILTELAATDWRSAFDLPPSPGDSSSSIPDVVSTTGADGDSVGGKQSPVKRRKRS